MACARCGKKVPKVTMQKTTVEKQELFDSGRYRVVRYNGANYTHFIGSPTGVIVADNLTSYGRAKDGNYLLVHVDDIKKTPNTFVVVSGDELEKAMAELELKPVVESTATVVANTPVTQSAKVVSDETTAVQPKSTEVDDEIEKAIEKTEEVDEAIKEVEEIARVNLAEGKVLTRSEALSPKDFAEQYGYTHHLQVMAKVRSGELLSYEDETGKKFVYHVEDGE